MDLDKDIAARVYDIVSSGGTAVFRTDVGYAIVGQKAAAIERIFSIKNRSYKKPCGCFGSLAMLDEMIDCSPEATAFARAVIEDEGLPLSIVGRYRPDHPVIANMEPFVRRNATKGGTIDLLMNAGPIHDEIARLALEYGRGVFGSSANLSLSGSKYSWNAVEPELRSGVDYAPDLGPTKYSHPDGLGSTIIDLDTFEPFRIGIRFDEIRAVAKARLGIDIPAKVKGT